MLQRVAPPVSPGLPETRLFDPADYDRRPIYNGALIRYQDRWIQTVRIGPANWTETWIGELTADLKPVRPFTLLSTQGSSKEDVRLWTCHGDLYASYHDLDWADGAVVRVHVNCCRLNADLSVAETYSPCVPWQKPWEKNWGFFEHDGDLYFVYSIDPHEVYRYVPGGTPELVSRSIVTHAWKGILRGGTPPLRVGDRFVSVFHFGNPSRAIGWYEFEANPPFRVFRVGEAPILECREVWKDGHWCVYYPISLFSFAGLLYLTVGEDDCRCRLLRWDYDAARSNAAGRRLSPGNVRGVAFARPGAGLH